MLRKTTSIREQSRRLISVLGFPEPPSHLPLSDMGRLSRPFDQVIHRSVCLAAVVSCCFGVDGHSALLWLEANGSDGELTEQERSCLMLGGVAGQSEFARVLEVRIEALWALCWVLCLVPDIGWTSYCGSNLKELLPNVHGGEAIASFRSRARLRNTREILKQEDLAYCLDWLAVEALKGRLTLPGDLRAYVIRQRRHALTWVLSSCSWDDTPLDT